LNKLGLRGKAKVTCQWMMFCMVHNIEKLWRYDDVKYGEGWCREAHIIDLSLLCAI